MRPSPMEDLVVSARPTSENDLEVSRHHRCHHFPPISKKTSHLRRLRGKMGWKGKKAVEGRIQLANAKPQAEEQVVADFGRL